jgi:hypothetical protein
MVIDRQYSSPSDKSTLSFRRGIFEKDLMLTVIAGKPAGVGDLYGRAG